jgi:hypothetical protein
MQDPASCRALPAYEKSWAGAPVHPQIESREGGARQLVLFVVFTSDAPTQHALRNAAALAGQLRARITLVVPQIVPYPMPLTTPPVLLDFSERRMASIAAEAEVETTVRIYLCRDRWDALTQALGPGSLVVLGRRKRWWPTSESMLARQLRRAGHEVVVVES